MEMQIRWRGAYFKVKHRWYSDYTGWRLRRSDNIRIRSPCWFGGQKMLKSHRFPYWLCFEWCSRETPLLETPLHNGCVHSWSLLNAATWFFQFTHQNTCKLIINVWRVYPFNFMKETKMALMHCSNAMQWAQILVCPCLERLIPDLLHFACRLTLLPHICPRKEKRKEKKWWGGGGTSFNL